MRQRKLVTCPSCNSTFEIQKVKAADIYQKLVDMKETLPDFEEVKDKTDEELAKHPLVLSTLGIILMVGSLRPKLDIEVDIGRNVLSIASLNECCLEFVTREIIDWSGMSQKAEVARKVFSATDPAKVVGMAAAITGERPSRIMDPQGVRFTDIEAAALDCSITVSTRKDLQAIETKETSLDKELDAKYEDWNNRLKIWS